MNYEKHAAGTPAFDDVSVLYGEQFTPNPMFLKVSGSNNSETSMLKDILENTKELTVRNGGENSVAVNSVFEQKFNSIYITPSAENNNIRFSEASFLEGLKDVLGANGFKYAHMEKSQKCHIFKSSVPK